MKLKTFFLLPRRAAKNPLTFYNSQQIFALLILALVNTAPKISSRIKFITITNLNVAFIILCPQIKSNTMKKLALFYSVSSKIIAFFPLPNKA